MSSPCSMFGSDTPNVYKLMVIMHHPPKEVHTVTESDPGTHNQPVMIEAGFEDMLSVYLKLDEWEHGKVRELELTCGYGPFSRVSVWSDGGLVFPDPGKGKDFEVKTEDWDAALERAIEATRKKVEELTSEEVIEKPEMCGEGVIVDMTDDSGIVLETTGGVEMESEDEVNKLGQQIWNMWK